MERPPLGPTVILGERFITALEISGELNRRLRALQKAAEPLVSADELAFLELKRLEVEGATAEFISSTRRLLSEPSILPRDFRRQARVILYLYNRRGLIPLITSFTAPRELFTDTIAGRLVISRANTFEALRRLERDGIVEQLQRRIPQPDGSRRASWRLTGKGISAAEGLFREAQNRGFDPTRV